MLWLEGSPAMSNGAWCGVTGVTALLVCVFAFCRAYAFMESCAKISGRTHDRMMGFVLHASVPLYFDVQPLGRILNRFAKDLDCLDMELPMYMFTFLQFAVLVLNVMLVCVVTSWAALIIVAPVLWIGYQFRQYYASTSRELKRLEGVSRTPLFNNFVETVGGLPHLRAFGMVDEQAAMFRAKCDLNFKVFFHLHALVPWLIYRMDLFAATMVFSIGISCLWLPRTVETAALLGFGLTTALNLMGRLVQTVQSSIETENAMLSVERMLYFETIPQETGDGGPGPEPGPEWPAEGRVRFDGVQLRYRPHLPLVLAGLSFEAAPGERVGIVGRTGCGKSSTMLALLRLVECEGGVVSIDGVDVSEVPLQRLRGRAVSIIPQDPYLFGGSLRDNLDPFHVQGDDAILAARIGGPDLRRHGFPVHYQPRTYP
ncbi:unnamed protein product, partial [Prorocentrum cordatum]